ncbi:hypothetical protein T02_1625 [Trichinella nativa]|uniref:Integrase catalytic domain-containing protein n=1 Tax=Trichinella nativa TaxID=6335 RepID=A0A0V1LA83_9BILA|nr:hypothetical protein T02_1625 [Trichinella nativa]
MPAYIHTDRGSSFMSNDLKTYLHSLGVVTSRTTAHNPRGNGQAERYNGIIWKAVTLALKSHNLRIEQWEEMMAAQRKQVGTEAHREEDEKAEKPDAHEVTPENSESEEDTATRQEHHQTPQPPRRPTRIKRAPQRLQNYVQY